MVKPPQRLISSPPRLCGRIPVPILLLVPLLLISVWIPNAVVQADRPVQEAVGNVPGRHCMALVVRGAAQKQHFWAEDPDAVIERVRSAPVQERHGIRRMHPAVCERKRAGGQ